MPKERNRAPLEDFGAYMKEAQKSLEFSRKNFYPQLDDLKDSRKVKRMITKIRLCPEKYLSVVEGTINEVLKLEKHGEAGEQ